MNKVAYVLGVQDCLRQGFNLKYASDELAEAHADAIAGEMGIDPVAEDEIPPEAVAEIAEALIELAAEEEGGLPAEAVVDPAVAEGGEPSDEELAAMLAASKEASVRDTYRSIFKKEAEAPDATGMVAGLDKNDGDESKEGGSQGKTTLATPKQTGNESDNTKDTGVESGSEASPMVDGTDENDGDDPKEGGAQGQTSLATPKQTGHEEGNLKKTSSLLERIRERQQR